LTEYTKARISATTL